MVVGSPYSNHAVVLRARPVIEIDEISVSGPSNVDSTNKNCQRSGTAYACFDVSVCSKYSRATRPVSVVIEVSLTVSSALQFDSSMGAQATVSVNMTDPQTQACSPSITVLVKSSARQFCVASTVSVSSWRFIEQQSTASRLSAVLHKGNNGLTLPTHSVQLIKACPSCKPNLRTNITNVTVDGNHTNQLILGVAKELVVAGHVDNIGDQIACQPTITLQSTQFLGATITTFSDEWDCGATGQTVITCVHSLGRLTPSEKVSFRGTLTVANLNKSHLAVEARWLNISVDIRSTNEDHDLTNNPSTHELAIFNEAEISLSINGLSKMVDINDKLLNPPNPTMTSSFRLNEVPTFQINNLGPGVTTAADILITFPFQTISGNYLYYLTDIDGTVANIICNHSKILNPRNFTGPTFRRRRSPVGVYPNLPASYSPDEVKKDCTGKICTISVQCRVSPVAPYLTGGIRFFWSVWTSTFNSEGLLPGSVNFTLSLLGISEDAGFKLLPPRPVNVNDTTMYRSIKKGTKSAEIWPIILAIIGAILLLILIILILKKSGFFKRPDARRDSAAALEKRDASTSGEGKEAAPESAGPESAAGANGTNV